MLCAAGYCYSALPPQTTNPDTRAPLLTTSASDSVTVRNLRALLQFHLVRFGQRCNFDRGKPKLGPSQNVSTRPASLLPEHLVLGHLLYDIPFQALAPTKSDHLSLHSGRRLICFLHLDRVPEHWHPRTALSAKKSTDCYTYTSSTFDTPVVTSSPLAGMRSLR